MTLGFTWSVVGLDFFVGILPIALFLEVPRLYSLLGLEVILGTVLCISWLRVQELLVLLGML